MIFLSEDTEIMLIDFNILFKFWTTIIRYLSLDKSRNKTAGQNKTRQTEIPQTLTFLAQHLSFIILAGVYSLKVNVMFGITVMVAKGQR